MRESLLRDLYKQRGYDISASDEAVGFVEEMESALIEAGLDIDTVSIEALKEYLTDIVSSGKNSPVRLLALARYYFVINKHDVYIYFTKLFGGYGVIDNIKKRLEWHTDKETVDAVFDNLNEPVLGSPPEMFPAFTSSFMKRLKKYLSPAKYRLVLAGNNHDIPEEAMQAEKKMYEKSASLDEYLKGRHDRNVAEIQQYCDEGKVWFEQEITQDMVDYVKSNQEILSTIRKNNKLYVTKIPFDGINYLATDDPVLKTYYACHCPFARERILDEGKNNVDANWCYCSAGFAKFPFEVLFGEELEVEMLKSALKGDPICRFVIKLPDRLF